MRGQERKSSFKKPPADIETSQHARRVKALEEQKRKRAQRIDSSRNLDLLAGLSLGSDNDEDDTGPDIAHGGLAQFASLLPSANTTSEVSMEASSATTTKPRKPRKPNTYYANKIMYAELLEMKDDPMFEVGVNEDNADTDGLPVDLDTNWVALAPVPQGKRCMAVANQSQGVPGTVSNTSLRSRLKGRTILTFPSPLPPSTILDCILDERWKHNGILHVLDIIRWKGQELGDCEANFRFWWRDTRLSELVSLPPYSKVSPEATSSAESQPQALFSYPVTFLPVPYHLDLSPSSLLSAVIPLSRTIRQVTIHLPPQILSSDTTAGDMEIDQNSPHHPATGSADIQPDGLLLYVSQASYEPGTSPLSSWVPIKSYEEENQSPLALFERLVARRASSVIPHRYETQTSMEQ